MSVRKEVEELVKKHAEIEAKLFASYIHAFFPNKSGTKDNPSFQPAFFEDRIEFRNYSIDEVYSMFKNSGSTEHKLKIK